MDLNIKVGDKVRIGDIIGEVIRLDNRMKSSIVKIAFNEGPAKEYFC